MQLDQEDVYTIHVGGKPDGPWLDQFDSATCKRFWEAFHSQGTEIWGREGLGVITVAQSQHGYDLHVLVRLHGSDKLLDCWMWRDPPDIHADWVRTYHHAA